MERDEIELHLQATLHLDTSRLYVLCGSKIPSKEHLAEMENDELYIRGRIRAIEETLNWLTMLK